MEAWHALENDRGSRIYGEWGISMSCLLFVSLVGFC